MYICILTKAMHLVFKKILSFSAQLHGGNGCSTTRTALKVRVNLMHDGVAFRGEGESNTGAFGFLRTRPSFWQT